eukprot:scaffold6291_cov230-Isochrysis_galbana.AAC.2
MEDEARPPRHGEAEPGRVDHHIGHEHTERFAHVRDRAHQHRAGSSVSGRQGLAPRPRRRASHPLSKR